MQAPRSLSPRVRFFQDSALARLQERGQAAGRLRDDAGPTNRLSMTSTLTKYPWRTRAADSRQIPCLGRASRRRGARPAARTQGNMNKQVSMGVSISFLLSAAGRSALFASSALASMNVGCSSSTSPNGTPAGAGGDPGHGKTPEAATTQPPQGRPPCARRRRVVICRSSAILRESSARSRRTARAASKPSAATRPARARRMPAARNGATATPQTVALRTNPARHAHPQREIRPR